MTPVAHAGIDFSGAGLLGSSAPFLLGKHRVFQSGNRCIFPHDTGL
jgi:hypothetical protein